MAKAATTASYSTLSPKHNFSSNNHQLNKNFLGFLFENPISRRSLSLYYSRPAKQLMKISAATPMIETRKSSSEYVPTIVEVDLGDWSYPIYIGSGLLNRPDLLQRHIHGKSVLVVTNTTLAPLYLDKVVAALTSGSPDVRVEYLILPDGEKYKDMDTFMKISGRAIKSQLDRRCTFVALGGGVISDLCGYAATSFVRGVNFIQIPTTVMAQVDSAVAGKTRINNQSMKNAFSGIYQPQCVLIDTDTLNTLPDRELASGLAEVIKYGLIRDASFFAWQEHNIQALMSRKWNLSKELDLGRIAIETSYGDEQWLHGEAVAAGMVIAVDMSYRLGWIDKSVVKRVNRILQQAKLPTNPPETMTVDMFKSVTAVDKEAANGLLRLILLKGPLGNCVLTEDYDQKALDETLRAFCKT